MGLDPARMQEAIIARLPRTTGHTLEEWIDRLGSSGAVTRAQRVAWLKGQGVGHVTAQIVVERAADGRAAYVERTDEFLEHLFGGVDDPRRRRFDVVRDAVLSLVPGADVTICKGYVGFSARRQFAVVRSQGDLLEVGVRHEPVDGVSVPVRGLGGGSIESAFRTDGALDEDQRRLVQRAAGVGS